MIFGFKQNPKKKILAFFKKGKSESAAEQLKVIWDELAVQDRLEILDSWPLKDSDKEMQQEWLSFVCLLYTSPSPRDGLLSRMPSSA